MKLLLILFILIRNCFEHCQQSSWWFIQWQRRWSWLSENNDNLENWRQEIWKICDTLFVMARSRNIFSFWYFFLLWKWEDNLYFMLFMEHNTMTKKFLLLNSYVYLVEHKRIRLLCLPLFCLGGKNVVVLFFCDFLRKEYFISYHFFWIPFSVDHYTADDTVMPVFVDEKLHRKSCSIPWKNRKTYRTITLWCWQSAASKRNSFKM